MEKLISFDDYENCVFNSDSKSISRSQLIFRNRKHEIHMVDVNKISLNRDDDKPIVKKNGISTLARGHSSGWNFLLGFISLS